MESSSPDRERIVSSHRTDLRRHRRRCCVNVLRHLRLPVTGSGRDIRSSLLPPTSPGIIWEVTKTGRSSSERQLLGQSHGNGASGSEATRLSGFLSRSSQRNHKDQTRSFSFPLLCDSALSFRFRGGAGISSEVRSTAGCPEWLWYRYCCSRLCVVLREHPIWLSLRAVLW